VPPAIDIETLNNIRDSALRDLADVINATSSQSLEAWHTSYLGRKGILTSILRGLSELPIEERRTIGTISNKIKAFLEEKYQTAVRSKTTSSGTLDDSPFFDVTLPGREIIIGRLHPTTQIVREISQIFSTMGFENVEGPEVELDTFNFEMLNIPQDHPARDMWDTMWIDYTDTNGNYPMLLRTHTSPMQARIMKDRKPPIRVLVPGKCYRYEATDATHEWHFYQIEGLAVGKDISFSHLKGTLYEFVRRMFGNDRQIRFRCDYFPFVEPGVEIAMDCFACNGDGCRICKGSGWIEILGAGMVHPNVLKGVGYDPTEYTGFAFGMGVERIAMLRHGIDDVRLFYNNDIRFLEQF